MKVIFKLIRFVAFLPLTCPHLLSIVVFAPPPPPIVDGVNCWNKHAYKFFDKSTKTFEWITGWLRVTELNFATRSSTRATRDPMGERPLWNCRIDSRIWLESWRRSSSPLSLLVSCPLLNSDNHLRAERACKRMCIGYLSIFPNCAIEHHIITIIVSPLETKSKICIHFNGISQSALSSYLYEKVWR